MEKMEKKYFMEVYTIESNSKLTKTDGKKKTFTRQEVSPIPNLRYKYWQRIVFSVSDSTQTHL